jgi:hypothetical protein
VIAAPPALVTGRRRPTVAAMDHRRRRAAHQDFGEAPLGAAQSSNPPDDPEMIAPDADPLDTDVEDADLFLGLEDEE